jgi:hypothetical protein
VARLTRHGRWFVAGCMAMAVAHARPARATDPRANGPWFVDRAGVRRSFPASYDGFFARRSRKPNYARAVAESAALVALGTAYYWVDPLANSADWDYPTLGQKLRFESVRFDNNLFATNHLLHPLAGTAVYGFARVNGLGVGTAFLDALVSSVAWEYLLEYREQVSINDMVFTPLGGLPIGEFLFQLGDYLNSAPDGGGLAQRVAASTLGLPQKVHDRIDGVVAPSTPPLDELGFSSAFAHRFVTGYELGITGTRRSPATITHGFAVEAQVVAMPGFLRAGRFARSFADGNFVSWRSRAGWGRDGSSLVDLTAHADLLGHYAQAIELSESGRHGRAALAALSSRFRFHQRNIAGERDRFATVQAPGPHAVFWWFGHGLLANLETSLHAEFAGIHPLAYTSWQRHYDASGARSLLRRQRYVYALGFSTLASAGIGVRDAGVGLSLSYGAYDSIEGVDRVQREVTTDVASHDTIRELAAFVSVNPSAGPMTLRLSFDELRRTGRMADIPTSRRERRLSLLSGVVF